MWSHFIVVEGFASVKDCWSCISGLRSGRYNHAEMVQHETPDEEDYKDEGDCVLKLVLDLDAVLKYFYPIWKVFTR